MIASTPDSRPRRKTTEPEPPTGRDLTPDELLKSVRFLPDQVRDIAIAAADVDGLPAVDTVREVVVLGVGGARIAGDVVGALCELHGRVPIVATGARCPRWVSDTTLAVAVSHLGGEDAAFAAAREARAAGAALIAVTTGGRLADACAHWGVPVVTIDPDAGPAAGLGATIIPVLVLLERLGFVSGMSKAVSSSAEQLAARLAALVDHDVINRLAEELPGRLAIVAGAGMVGKHAARRWVQELDQVGEIAAVRRRLPTGSVDVAAGVRLMKATERGAVLILLRHDYEPEGLDGGVAMLPEHFERIHTFRAEGDTALAQLLDLVVVSDAVAAALLLRASRQ